MKKKDIEHCLTDEEKKELESNDNVRVSDRIILHTREDCNHCLNYMTNLLDKRMENFYKKKG